MDGLPRNPRVIYMEFLWDGQMTNQPLGLENEIHTPQGNMVK
jgi:hypothetical protein